MPACAGSVDGLDIDRLDGVIAEHRSDGARHLVLGDVEGCHRIMVQGGGADRQLAYVIAADQSFSTRIAVAARLTRLMLGQPSGPLPLSCHPSVFQHMRLVQLLRLIDGERAGASRRDLAFAILFRNRASMTSAEWKGSNERRRTLRMLAEAHRIIQGGYRALLQGELPKARQG